MKVYAKFLNNRTNNPPRPKFLREPVSNTMHMSTILNIWPYYGNIPISIRVKAPSLTENPKQYEVYKMRKSGEYDAEGNFYIDYEYSHDEWDW